MPKTQEEKLNELHQAVIGIPDSPVDNGLIGDVKDIKTLIKTQNGRINSNTRSISKIKGTLIGLGSVAGIAGIVIGVIRILA